MFFDARDLKYNVLSIFFLKFFKLSYQTPTSSLFLSLDAINKQQLEIVGIACFTPSFERILPIMPLDSESWEPGSLWSSRWAPPGSTYQNPIIVDDDQPRVTLPASLAILTSTTMQSDPASGTMQESSLTTSFSTEILATSPESLVQEDPRFSEETRLVTEQFSNQAGAGNLALEGDSTPDLYAQFSPNINGNLQGVGSEAPCTNNCDRSSKTAHGKSLNDSDDTAALPVALTDNEQRLRSVGDLGLGLATCFPGVICDAHPSNHSLRAISSGSSAPHCSLNPGRPSTLARELVGSAIDEFETSNNMMYRPLSYIPETIQIPTSSSMYAEHPTTHTTVLTDRQPSYSSDSSERRWTSVESRSTAFTSRDDSSDEGWGFCRRCTRLVYEHDLAHPEQGTWCCHCLPTNPWDNSQCQLCQKVLLDWERAYGTHCLHCAYDPALEARVVSWTRCRRCVSRLLPGEDRWYVHCLPASREREECCDHCGRRMCEWESRSGRLCVHCVIELGEDVLGLILDFWWQ